MAKRFRVIVIDAPAPLEETDKIAEFRLPVEVIETLTRAYPVQRIDCCNGWVIYKLVNVSTQEARMFAKIMANGRSAFFAVIRRPLKWIRDHALMTQVIDSEIDSSYALIKVRANAAESVLKLFYRWLVMQEALKGNNLLRQPLAVTA